MTYTLVVCKPKLPEQYLTQRLALKRALDEAGHSGILYFPVFELVPDFSAMSEIAAWPKQDSEKPNRLMVFVSPSVLEIVLTHLGGWPSNVWCGVMGKQSAKLAVDLGVPAEQVIAPTGEGLDESEDSDGLARLLGRQFESGTCEVLVCKGPRGCAEFPLKLEDMGHHVRVLECYDRRVIQQADIQINALLELGARAALWITSSETIEVLDQQLALKSDPRLTILREQSTVLTTHPRIAAKCRELGYAHVVQIATGIQSVNSWLKSNKKSMDNNKPITATLPPASPSPATVQPSTQWLGKAAFFISVLSFVLILLIAFAGKNQIEKTRMAFGERIQKESTTLDLVKEDIGKSSDLTKDLKTRFDLLELAQKEEASQRASLEEVYNSLLASRTEVSLSEVEQLISIAKRQLYLLGNVKGASIALSQAIELLEGTEKPSLLNLRTALEKDLSEINALPTDDLLRLAISLDSVVNSVESLPMLSSVQATTDQTLAELTEDPATGAIVDPEAPAANAAQTSTADAGYSFERGLAFVKEVVKAAWYDIKSLVEVTKVNSPEVLLLSSRQETDLRNTLRLSLLNARISLLSRQATLLKSDLERSASLINTYFDTQALQVQRAQSILSEISEVQLDLVLPELQATSAALRLAVAGQQGERQ